MGLEFLLIALFVVLFGGMFLGLALAYRETEAQRAASAPAKGSERDALGLYEWRASDEAMAQELMLRQLEHYLRREAMMAEQFINNPTPQTLRAGRQQIGTC